MANLQSQQTGLVGSRPTLGQKLQWARERISEALPKSRDEAQSRDIDAVVAGITNKLGLSAKQRALIFNGTLPGGIAKINDRGAADRVVRFLLGFSATASPEAESPELAASGEAALRAQLNDKVRFLWMEQPSHKSWLAKGELARRDILSMPEKALRSLASRKLRTVDSHQDGLSDADELENKRTNWAQTELRSRQDKKLFSAGGSVAAVSDIRVQPLQFVGAAQAIGHDRSALSATRASLTISDANSLVTYAEDKGARVLKLGRTHNYLGTEFQDKDFIEATLIMLKDLGYINSEVSDVMAKGQKAVDAVFKQYQQESLKRGKGGLGNRGLLGQNLAEAIRDEYVAKFFSDSRGVRTDLSAAIQSGKSISTQGVTAGASVEDGLAMVYYARRQTNSLMFGRRSSTDDIHIRTAQKMLFSLGYDIDPNNTDRKTFRDVIRQYQNNEKANYGDERREFDLGEKGFFGPKVAAELMRDYSRHTKSNS